MSRRFWSRSNRDNRPTNVDSNIGNDDISTTIENINTLTDSVSRAQDDKWAFYSRLEQMLNNLNITKGVLYEHIVAAIELIKNLRKSKDEFTRKNEEQIEELRTTKSALEKSKQSLSQIKNQLSDVNKNKLKLIQKSLNEVNEKLKNMKKIKFDDEPLRQLEQKIEEMMGVLGEDQVATGRRKGNYKQRYLAATRSSRRGGYQYNTPTKRTLRTILSPRKRTRRRKTPIGKSSRRRRRRRRKRGGYQYNTPTKRTLRTIMSPRKRTRIKTRRTRMKTRRNRTRRRKTPSGKRSKRRRRR